MKSNINGTVCINNKTTIVDKQKQQDYNREYYKNNKDRIKLYSKIYNNLHKEKNLQYLREYYENIQKSKNEKWLKAMFTHSSTRYKPPRKGCFDKGRKVSGFERQHQQVTVSFE